MCVLHCLVGLEWVCWESILGRFSCHNWVVSPTPCLRSPPPLASPAHSLSGLGGNPPPSSGPGCHLQGNDSWTTVILPAVLIGCLRHRNTHSFRGLFPQANRSDPVFSVTLRCLNPFHAAVVGPELHPSWFSRPLFRPSSVMRLVGGLAYLQPGQLVPQTTFPNAGTESSLLRCNPWSKHHTCNPRQTNKHGTKRTKSPPAALNTPVDIIWEPSSVEMKPQGCPQR